MHPGDLARHHAYMPLAADTHFTAEETLARPAGGGDEFKEQRPVIADHWALFTKLVVDNLLP
jgi:hypothetical protein